MQNAKYSGAAMALHWLVVLAVLATLIVLQRAESAPTREASGEIMGTHFAIGVVIFLLVIARFIWRMVNPPPSPMQSHAEWEKTLARVTHLLMYALLLVMPLAGWYAKSKFESPINVFGLFEVPPLPVTPDPEMGKAIFEGHELAGKVLIALIVVHILATIKHMLIDKDGAIYRMLPFGTPKG